MEVIICIAVLISWLLMLIGWIEFFLEVFMNIIRKDFNILETLEVFGFLTVSSVFVLWMGIQAIS